MNWEKISLDTSVTIMKGKKPTILKNNSSDDFRIPYVTIEAFENQKAFQYTNSTSNIVITEKNDVLIVWDGARFGLIGKSIGGALGSTLAKLLPREFIDSDFLYYFLSKNYELLRANQRGAGIPHIDGNYLRSIPIPIPAISEQKRILEILKQADDLRKKKKEVIDKSEKIITALFYKMFGDPLSNEKGWNVDNLKNVINLHYGNSLQREKRVNGKYPVFGSNGIVGFHDEYLIDYPTIVIGRKGSAGSVNLVNEPSFPIDTTFYTTIKKKLNIDFLYQYLKILDLKRLAITTGVPGVNRDDIYKQMIILPPIELQDKFSNLAINARRILDDVKKTSGSINVLFENLLYTAFTGELTKSWREKNKAQISKEIAERKLKYGF